jgi:hypothetical protein
MDLTESQYEDYLYSLQHPNIEEINKRVKKPIGESEIYDYFGYGFNIQEDVITYSELDKFNDIEEVLEANKQWKIILIEESKFFGHWVVILRYGKTIEYFNSYGDKPSYELDLLSDKKNRELGQDEKYLNKLLLLAKNKYKVIYNSKRFQKLANQINTCGRWCIFRVIMMDKYNMSLSQFIKYMEELKKYYNMTYDQIVSLIII